MATTSYTETMYDMLNGKRCTLDGVSGTLRYTAPYRPRYVGEIGKLEHEADAKGRQSEAYRATRRVLGDDYVTDLTWSERAVALAYKLLSKDQIADLESRMERAA